MRDQNDTAEDDEMLHDGAGPAHPGEPQRTGQEAYAEHDNVHPTPNQKEICLSLQLKNE